MYQSGKQFLEPALAGKKERDKERWTACEGRKPARNGARANGVPPAGAVARELDEALSAVLRELLAAMTELPAGAAARDPIVAAIRAAQRAEGLNRQLLTGAGREQEVDLSANGGEATGGDEAGDQRCALVIDDELDVREAVADILEIKGLHVLAAADGKRGLELYQEHGADVDLVLLDLSMPKMGGEETCRRLREMDPEVRVLVTSGYDKGKTDGPLERLRPDGFLPKPYDMETLVDAVFEIIGGGGRDKRGVSRADGALRSALNG